MKRLNIGMIGYMFMGKAHSNAWKNASNFFDLPYEPTLKVVCGRHKAPLKEFANKWGWEEIETDWKNVIERDDIDVIDICVPTYLHHEIAIAASKAGKHIFCEKPLALNYPQAKEMYEAVKATGVMHFLNHNYRKCPAVMLARQFIDEGKIGRIFHWRGAYLQDWIIDPNFPLTWHLRKETAGAGAHNDLNSHSVDLARYLIGDIKSVMGLSSTFINERPLPEGAEVAFSAKSTNTKMGEVTVDDATSMLVEFENGAVGSFEASRFANGRKNYNTFEIYGEKGSICFNLERMNEIEFYSSEDPGNAQGFRTILVTEGEHPYIQNWWPPGHIIGYEHEFIHTAVEFMNSIAENKLAEPNFYDGMKAMQVLEAGLESSRTGRKISI